MIVRCAKCRELLDYSNAIIVDSCSRGCDAGFQVAPEANERISPCWYHNNSSAVTRLRDDYSWLRKPMVSESDITCWYKASVGGEWKTGFFLKWATDYEEFESGPGQFPVALIEDAVDSLCRVVYAEHISFSPECPK